MRISLFSSFLHGASSYVAANPISTLNSLGDYEAADLMKRAGGCPGLPANADPNLLHVDHRLDKRPARAIEGNKEMGITMDNLKQLLKDMYGRHIDVLIGNSKECKSFDLAFKDKTWLNYNDGDGAPIQARERAYMDLGADQQLQYKGHLPAGTTLAKVHSERRFILLRVRYWILRPADQDSTSQWTVLSRSLEYTTTSPRTAARLQISSSPTYSRRPRLPTARRRLPSGQARRPRAASRRTKPRTKGKN